MAADTTTSDYLAKLKNLKSLFAAKLAAEGTGATEDSTFNELVEQAQTLHGTDKKYNPESEKAQSGIAVAEGIDESVGDINGALSNLTEPSEIDPAVWMNEAVDAAVEEIKTENQKTIASQVQAAVSTLSTENETNIKRQIADAVDNLDFSTKKAFLLNAKRITDGNIILEENTIYAIAKTPAENTLTVYDIETLEPIIISDKHYCIFVGIMGSDIADAVCATVLSYPSLDPQLYVVKKDDLQSTITWSGTAICSIVKNAPIE